jgi:hypothetical protein
MSGALHESKRINRFTASSNKVEQQDYTEYGAGTNVDLRGLVYTCDALQKMSHV